MTQSLLDVNSASQLAVTEISAMVLANVLSPEIFNHGQVMDNPVSVYDLNGEVLFYRFSLSKDRKVFGYVDIATAAALADPLLCISSGQAWKPEEIIETARQAVKDRDVNSVRPRFVAFDYPRLAVQFQLSATESITIDPTSGQEVQPVKTQSRQEIPSALTARSLLDSISSANKKKNISLYSQHLNAWKSALLPGEGLHPAGSPQNQIWKIDTQVFGKGQPPIIKNLYCQYLVGYGQAATDHRPCFELRTVEGFGTIHSTSIQMILQYYRYSYSQDVVMKHLKLFDSKGRLRKTVDVIADGLRELSCGCLSVSVIKNPDFSDFQSELMENRPVIGLTATKSRVIAGTLHDLLHPSPAINHLLIYDPLNPPAVSTQQWESFDALSYTHLITARLNLTN